ncbi:hypothetical protein ScPMuIL_004017 [Solemya velum]
MKIYLVLIPVLMLLVASTQAIFRKKPPISKDTTPQATTPQDTTPQDTISTDTISTDTTPQSTTPQSTIPPPPSCPNVLWASFPMGEDTLCLSSPEEKTSWIDGQIWCGLEYGYLATPISAEFEIAIENFIQTLNRRKSDYWLGGSNALNVSDWWWFTNQFNGNDAIDHYGYTDWAQGYPQDNDNQNCLYLDLNADGPTAWRNDNCRLKKFPVCMVYSSYSAL